MINESNNNIYYNDKLLNNYNENPDFLKIQNFNYFNKINNYSERGNNFQGKIKLMKNLKNKNIKNYNPIENKRSGSLNLNNYQEKNYKTEIITEKNNKNHQRKDNYSISNYSNTNINNTNNNKRNNSNTSVYSSNKSYWEKREIKTKNKLNTIKREELNKKKLEYRIKPKICKKSIEIAKKLLNNENVFERLGNGNTQRKHIETIKKISEKINKNKNPNINLSSQRIKRSIQDLYKWKNKIENKKKEKIEYYNNQNINQSFKINQLSQEILFENKPDYLNMKVEERLFEQGKILQKKKEEDKEIYYQKIHKPIFKINKNYSFIESRYLKSSNTENNNKKVKKRINSTLNKNKDLNNKNVNSKSTRNNKNLNNIYYSNLNINEYNSTQDFHYLNNDEKNESKLKDIRKHLNDFYIIKKKNENNKFQNEEKLNNIYYEYEEKLENNILNINEENLSKNIHNNDNENLNIIYQSNNILNNINYQIKFPSDNNFINNSFPIQFNNKSGSKLNDKGPEVIKHNNFLGDNYYNNILKEDNKYYLNYNSKQNNLNINKDKNIIEEIFQKHSDHLDYLDERLRKNEESRKNILSNL